MKRKILSWLVCAVLAASLIPAAAAADVPAGSGTASDPFILTSASEFSFISDFPEAHYKLGQNITLPATWTGLSADSFSGTLDGGGYTLSIASPSSRRIDGVLGGSNRGTIRNLTVSADITLQGSKPSELTTALFCSTNYGTIENCVALGSITINRSSGVTGSFDTGAFAQTNNGTIRNCYSRVNLTYTYPQNDKTQSYDAHIAGIAGYSDAGDVINCYYAGVLSGSYTRPVGYYDMFNVTRVDGEFQHKGSTFSSTYHDKDLSGNADSNYITTAKSTAAMKMQINYTGWDFNTVWYIDAAMNDGYPVLRSERRFTIPAGTAPGTNPGSSDEIRVYVDGVQLTFDQPPIATNGRTLVPVRAIFEALGAEVQWNGENQTILGHQASSNTTIMLQLGVNTMAKQQNGGAIVFITLDVAPFAINGRTLGPVRAISEAYQCDVQWDGATRSVIITT